MARNNSAPANKTGDMPAIETRLATISTDSTDGADAAGGADGRSFRLKWTTGAQVKRYSWDGPFMEELAVDPKSVDLSRADTGMPFLRDHDASSIDNVIGTVERMWLENGEGWATVRMSKRPDVAGIISDMQDGILSSVSVGYRIDDFKMVDNGAGQMPTRQVTRWTPVEVSLVTIPADQDAGLRSFDGLNQNQEQEAMSDNNETRAAVPAVDIEAIKAEARAEGEKAAAERITAIRSAVKAAKLGDEFADKLINGKTSVDAARAAVLDELAKRDEATETRSVGGSSVRIVRDEIDSLRSGLSDALAHRAGATKDISEHGRQYRHMTMLDMVKETMTARGESLRGLSPMDIVMRASAPNTTSGDLPAITLNVINKILRQAYEARARTFLPLVRDVPVTDFRPQYRIQISESIGGSLPTVAEGAEYTYASVSDTKASYSLMKFGRLFSVSWESILADDTSALTRLPAMFGNSAASAESDWFYLNTLRFNSGVGPTMDQDSVNLFDATHGNVTSASAISIAGVAAAEALMLEQVGVDGQTFINIQPKFMVVGTDRKIQAQQLLGKINPVQETEYNPYSGAFDLIVEPRLRALAGNNPSDWYLFADPSQIEGFETAHLMGESGPMVQQEPIFNGDGFAFKARHTFGVKALDWRGVVRVPGA